MKKLFTYLVISLLLVIGEQMYAQITSAASGNWNDTETWVGGEVPTSADNVVIASGHIITINSDDAVCNSLSFGATSSKIDLFNATSVLSVYGDFTPFSTSHVPFSNWEDGAKLTFKGSAATQTINNIPNNNTSTTMPFFKNIVVDKSSGKVTFAGSTDSKLNISNSLEIVSGTFEIPSAFDINGRTLDGSDGASPDITVYANGNLSLVGGATQIMRRATGNLGTFTLYGTANFVTTSTNRINFDNTNIESGGVLTISTGGSSNTLNLGNLTIKNGGRIENVTTTNVWNSGTTLTLNNGGVFKSTTTTTPVPTIVSNNGTFWYARSTATDQTIVDMDYHRLELSFSSSGHNKVWTLGSDRVITDSLETNNTANLIVSASSSRNLTVNGTVRLTTGSIDISNANVNFRMADGTSISRATGTISNAPTFLGSVNLKYTSVSTDVSMGPEAPTSSSALNNLEILTSSRIVTAENAYTINGTLILTSGIFDINGPGLTMADGSTLRRVNGSISASPDFAGAKNIVYANTSAITTGNELPDINDDISVEGTGKLELGKNITVNGDMTVSGILDCTNKVVSGSGTFTLSNDGSLYIGSANGISASGASGNIQTTTRDFSTQGYYYYNGTSAQITGDGLPTTIKRLYFSNPNGVTLSDDVNTTDRLEFLEGNSGGVVYGNGFTITIGSSPSNVGTASGGSNGHINGKMKRWISTSNANTDRFFYTGTATQSRNAVVNFSSITTGGTLTAEFIEEDPEENGLPLDDDGYEINKIAPNGYWSITSGDDLNVGEYTLRLVARNFTNVNDYLTLRIVKRENSSSPWTLDGAAGTNTGSNSVPSVIRNGVSGFSEFAIGSNSVDNPLPIQLVSFNASVINNQVKLDWKTSSEINSYGFDIQRSTDINEYESIGFIEGSGNSNSLKEYSFTDKLSDFSEDLLMNSASINYRLKSIDIDGSYSFSKIISIDANKLNLLPNEFALLQNYPNPFNPKTTIKFQIPVTIKPNEKIHVTLKVYDILGNEVAVLVNEELSPGTYTKNFDLYELSKASGVYYYRLVVNSHGQTKIFNETRKMLLLK